MHISLTKWWIYLKLLQILDIYLQFNALPPSPSSMTLENFMLN